MDVYFVAIRRECDYDYDKHSLSVENYFFHDRSLAELFMNNQTTKERARLVKEAKDIGEDPKDYVEWGHDKNIVHVCFMDEAYTSTISVGKVEFYDEDF